MKKQLIIIAVLFLCVRCFTVYFYNIRLQAYYYYGQVQSQFLIAEAAYRGHWFSRDITKGKIISKEAARKKKFIPIEEYGSYEGSGVYETFNATDLPGYGYIIAFTSKHLGDRLTSRYAFFIQVMMELISLLLFVYCVGLALGEKTAFAAGLIYVFFYIFNWHTASQPMRDIFLMPVYAFYIAAYFFFQKAAGAKQYLLPVFFIIIASLLLWIRPSGYYLFFFMSPLIFFMKGKSLAAKTAILLITIVVPVLVFGSQFSKFNMRHYGVENTHVIGRGMWEGMGIIEDNPYGFKLDDEALLPWCREMGLDVEYGSPEMNKALKDYVFEIIKKDPVFYLRTVLVRTVIVLKTPLYFILPHSLLEEWSGSMHTKEYLKNPSEIFKDPGGFFRESFAFFIQRVYGFFFFWLAIGISLWMFIRLKQQRLGLLILLSPVLYSLASQLPLHFEHRYFATAAWVLVMPLAWFAAQKYETMVEKRRHTLD